MTNTQRTIYFRKRDIVAAWVIQYVCATIYLVLGIISIVNTAGGSRFRVSIDGIVYTILALITIGLDIAECVTFAQGRLHPVFLLVSAIFKTGVWCSFFILLICSFAFWGGFYSPLSFVILLLLFGSSLSQLVIASLAVHKRRKEAVTIVVGGGASGAEQQANKNSLSSV